ncbi:MAG: exodeoxyribonuclease VII large subunit [Candidatus Omnitrophica bacterium]|jgi:exodeoxyribonuclease VII large subunit|nr:exodeoxyribonuclease VII large subunit [Candidatus Omnitrophota bacterium]
MPIQDQQERQILTVSQITQDIKLILEANYASVWVEGEISNFKAAASGHFYFSLKDQSAVLQAAMFARSNQKLNFKIEDGLKVICFGKIDVYAPRGQYQLIIEQLQPKGIGAQQLAFEQLKEKLFKEGLFDVSHKKELPRVIFRAGVVTSSAGAAVRDILQVLKRGAACVDVVIRPSRVQGEGACFEIASGIEELNQYNQVDVIIVSRGGGSVEDLWAFNEEKVARAIYNSRLPVISAVGHQINTTLSDLTADIFVETPTAAAKIIVDKKNALLTALENMRYQMDLSFSEKLNTGRHALALLKGMLKSPLDRLLEKQQLLDELSERLKQSMSSYIKFTRERFFSLAQRMHVLSPLSVLSRGYSLSMLMENQQVLKNADQLKAGDKVSTILERGSFTSLVESVNLYTDKQEGMPR